MFREANSGEIDIQHTFCVVLSVTTNVSTKFFPFFCDRIIRLTWVELNRAMKDILSSPHHNIRICNIDSMKQSGQLLRKRRKRKTLAVLDWGSPRLARRWHVISGVVSHCERFKRQYRRRSITIAMHRAILTLLSWWEIGNHTCKNDKSLLILN